MKRAATEQRSVILQGRSVNYRVAGGGPPLILLHGLSGSSLWWGRNIGPLSARFTVYAIDLPGFGENRARGPFVLGEAAARLGAWMDAVGLRRASIAGHSMGGCIAADFAAGTPDRVDRLILIDAPLFPYTDGLVRLAANSAAMARRLPIRFLPILIRDALRAGPSTLRSASREALAADLGPRLAAITAPALVIWGERDHLFPPAYGRRVAEALPKAKFTVIDGAGHNAMWDRPAAFNLIALNFLQR